MIRKMTTNTQKTDENQETKPILRYVSRYTALRYNGELQPTKIDHVITYICHQNRENPIAHQEFPLTAERMRGILAFVQIFHLKYYSRKMFATVVAEYPSLKSQECVDPLDYYADLEIVHGMCDEGMVRLILFPYERDLIIEVMQALKTVETQDILDMHDDLMPTSDVQWAYYADVETLRECGKLASVVWNGKAHEWSIRVKPAKKETVD